MSESSSFSKRLIDLRKQQCTRLTEAVLHSVDHLFNLALNEFIEQRNDEISWSENLPVIMEESGRGSSKLDEDKKDHLPKSSEVKQVAEKISWCVINESENSGSDIINFEPTGYIPPVRIVSLECPVSACTMNPATEHQLLEHLKTCHKIYEYRCIANPRCNYSTEKLPKILKHYREKHRELGKWTCSKCAQQFTKWTDLKNHLIINHERGIFACRAEGCLFEGVHRGIVLEHFHRLHQSDNGSAKKVRIVEKNGTMEAIPVMNTQTEDVSDYSSDSPQLNAQKVVIQQVQCYVQRCNVHYASLDDLKTHLQKEHFLKPYLCIVANCELSFFTVTQLSNHIHHHHADVWSWECANCHHVLKNHLQLHHHIVNSHQRGTFLCAGCHTFTASFRDAVLKHFDEQHQV